MFNTAIILLLAFSLLGPIISTVILISKNKAKGYILGVDVLVYLTTITVFNNIFPLRVSEFSSIYAFGFIKANLFWGYPSDVADFIKSFGEIHIWSISFGLALGFLGPIFVRNMRKFKYTFIYLAIIMLLTESSLVLPNIILGGLNRIWNLENPLMTIIFYILGFFLAKLVICLTPGITKPFDKPKVSNKDNNEAPNLKNKIIRENKFEDI